MTTVYTVAGKSATSASHSLIDAVSAFKKRMNMLHDLGHDFCGDTISVMALTTIVKNGQTTTRTTVVSFKVEGEYNDFLDAWSWISSKMPSINEITDLLESENAKC